MACAPTAAALHLRTHEINQLPTAHRAGASQDEERGEDHNFKSVRTHMPMHTPRSPITELGQMRTSNISIAVNYFFHKIFNN